MPENSRATDRILAVIVLYKQQIGDSLTFKSLAAAGQNPNCITHPVRTLIYDNTPDASSPGPLPENVRYETSGHNDGLAVAYNRALDLADELGIPWLLLLDQDTVLPPDFLESLLRQLDRWSPISDVVAVAPIVRSRNVVISPKRVGFLGLNPLGADPYGLSLNEIMAINSGTTVRCDFVRSIGGFNRAYWLNYLDHWLFRQIYKHGKRAVVSDCLIEHDLSVQDYRRNINLPRYQDILHGESAFMTSQKPKSQIPFYLFRLAVRSVRMVVQGQSDLAMYTMRTLVKIALHPMRSLEEEPR